MAELRGKAALYTCYKRVPRNGQESGKSILLVPSTHLPPDGGDGVLVTASEHEHEQDRGRGNDISPLYIFVCLSPFVLPSVITGRHAAWVVTQCQAPRRVPSSTPPWCSTTWSSSGRAPCLTGTSGTRWITPSTMAFSATITPSTLLVDPEQTGLF